jgi:hypothetical protein
LNPSTPRQLLRAGARALAFSKWESHFGRHPDALPMKVGTWNGGRPRALHWDPLVVVVRRMSCTHNAFKRAYDSVFKDRGSRATPLVGGDKLVGYKKIVKGDGPTMRKAPRYEALPSRKQLTQTKAPHRVPLKDAGASTRRDRAALRRVGGA